MEGRPDDKNLNKQILWGIGIVTATICIWMLFNLYNYPEIAANLNDVINENTIHDFEYEGGIITSTSSDPWIIFEFDRKNCVKTVEVEIQEIFLCDNVTAAIFAVGNNWESEKISLHKGNNYVSYHYAIDPKKYLRLDLAEKPGISICVGNIIINNHSIITKIAFKESIFLAFIFLSIYILCCFIENGRVSKVLNGIVAFIDAFYETIKSNCRVKEFGILVFKCWAVFILSILAILKSDFLYIDDIGRSYSGSMSDWDIYSRYLSQIVCKILSAEEFAVDVSPLSQIITMLFMAIAVSLIIWCLVLKAAKSNWIIVAAIPFAISPYFMENISYKIECIMHGTAVLFSVLPLALSKKRNVAYIIFTAICIVCTCITYQGALGIFPIVIVMLAVDEWSRSHDNKETWRLIWTSVVGYIVGLLFFKLFIMKDVSTHVSSDMLPLNKMFNGVINNVLGYYAIVINDFKIGWLILCVLVLLVFVVIFVNKSVHQKGLSLIAAIASIFFILLLAHGIYIVLEKCVYNPRAMISFGVMLSLFCIYIIGNGKYFSKLVCIFLSWGFITFSFTYGNCLVLQEEYTNVKMQAVICYINENYDSDTNYTIELENYIGLAPAIQDKAKNNNILKKLVPKTLGGGWTWSEYKLFRYYGLQPNFSFVWAWDKSNAELTISDDNLPLKDSMVFFDVYSDNNKILISFK